MPGFSAPLNSTRTVPIAAVLGAAAAAAACCAAVCPGFGLLGGSEYLVTISGVGCSEKLSRLRLCVVGSGCAADWVSDGVVSCRVPRGGKGGLHECVMICVDVEREG